MTMYIATRNTAIEMQTILNTTRIPQLNQSFAKTLRKAAMDNGIKQTDRGQRLEFYPVELETFNRIKTRDDMLIAIDKEKMNTALAAINNKPEYQGGMQHEVHQKYLKELRNAMNSVVQKIGVDAAPVKTKRPAAGHDFNVGDWIELIGDWGHHQGTARITRVTTASYWYEVASIDGRRYSNLKSCQHDFNGVTGWQSACNQEWDFTIPYAGNEHRFTFQEPRQALGSTKQYGNPSKVAAGYRSLRVSD